MARPLPSGRLARVPSVSPGGHTRAGEVRDMVLRRMHDPILLMQVNHRRLNVGMAQHGLDLPNRGPMVQGQRGGRMAQRMGGDRADTLCLRVEQPMEAGLLQMRTHHGLDGADAQRPAAATLGDIVRLGMILPRPPQPTEERMLGEQAAERVRRAPALMVSGVMDLKVGREGFEYPGSQHHRLLRRVAAFPMEIEDRMSVTLREMPPLRPREFNTPGAGTDPEQRHRIVPPDPLLNSRVGLRQIKGVH